MRIEYDPKHDVLNIEFLADVEIEESLEMDGIIIDYAQGKRIVAIEILDASKRTTRDVTEFIDLTVIHEKVEA